MVPHYQSLLAHAKRITKNKEDAEDLCQDTMIEAWKYLSSYTPGTNSRSWLFRILINLSHKRYQTSLRRPQEDLNGWDESYEGLEIIESAESTFTNKIVNVEIIEALEKLPEEFREACYLRDIEGYSYSEIGVIMNAPIGTGMSRVFRARNLLRENLKDYEVVND